MKNIKNFRKKTDPLKQENKDQTILLGVFKNSTVFILIIGISLHFLGQIAHETYLKKLGVDPALFSQTVYETEIHGYYTLFNRLAAAGMLAMENWMLFAIFGLCFACYTLITFFFQIKTG